MIYLHTFAVLCYPESNKEIKSIDKLVAVSGLRLYEKDDFLFPVLLVREKTCEEDCIGFNTHKATMATGYPTHLLRSTAEP